MTTKEKIIQKTLEIISKEGLEDATARKITKEAGVNTASINYHFGTIENLIHESIKVFFQEVQKIFQDLGDEKNTPEIILKNFLEKFGEYSIKYPGMIKGIFVQIMTGKHTPSYSMGKDMKKASKKLEEIVRNITGVKDKDELSIICFDAVSSLIYPVLVSVHLKKISVINYQDEKFRKKYINYIYKKIINNK